MIKAELMEDGKTVATEGNGEAPQVLKELMYLLNMIRIQTRASCEDEVEEAEVLLRLSGILAYAREMTVDDLKQISDNTENRNVRNGIRKNLKYIERFDRASKKERAVMGRALVEGMRVLLVTPPGEQENPEEEEALKRALEEDQE